MDLNTMRTALEGATAAPFALYAWKQNPDGDAWGVVNITAETGAIWADGKQQEQVLRGYVVLFTRTLNRLPEIIQGVLNDLGVSWRFETQDYEEDTGLMHYTWRWEDWRG